MSKKHVQLGNMMERFLETIDCNWTDEISDDCIDRTSVIFEELEEIVKVNVSYKLTDILGEQ